MRNTVRCTLCGETEVVETMLGKNPLCDSCRAKENKKTTVFDRDGKLGEIPENLKTRYPEIVPPAMAAARR